MYNQKYRVVFVDDDEIEIENMNDYFGKNTEFSLNSYLDPEDVIKNFHKDKPNIIISDYNMPNMNGIELLKKIKSINSEVEFIIVSGFDDINAVIKALQFKASNYIQKPVDYDLLREIIYKSIRTIEKEDKNKFVMFHIEKIASLGLATSEVVHDIKNPLSYIKTNLSGLDKYYDYIIKSVKHYAEVVTNQKDKNILNFIATDIFKLFNNISNGCNNIQNILERVESYSYQDKFEFTTFNINNLVSSVIDIIGIMKPSNVKIDFIKDFDPDLSIKGSYVELEEVFLNLINNAIQACEKKTNPEVKVKWSFFNPFLEFSVFDNGVGIENENLSKIFEPFFTTKPKGRGTGLGLNIVRKIVESHYGTIDIGTKLGEGTTFTVHLPVDFE